MVKKIIYIILIFNLTSCSFKAYKGDVPPEYRVHFCNCYNPKTENTLLKTNGYYKITHKYSEYIRKEKHTPFKLKHLFGLPPTEITDSIVKNFEGKIYFSKDNLFIYLNYTGIYTINKDTVIASYINDDASQMAPWVFRELRFIVDKNGNLKYLTEKQFENLTKSELESFNNSNKGMYDYSIQFVEDTVNEFNNFRLLKQKWFWCNEEDWQQYMDNISK